MPSNGTNQSQLYAARGGYSDGNSIRNRSSEQQHTTSGNPNMPQYNISPYGAGGQQYGYNRYIPPMLFGGQWNTQNTGMNNPYSYNTPNSYGSNFMGGNNYNPMPLSPMDPTFMQAFNSYMNSSSVQPYTPQSLMFQNYPGQPQQGGNPNMMPGFQNGMPINNGGYQYPGQSNPTPMPKLPATVDPLSKPPYPYTGPMMKPAFPGAETTLEGFQGGMPINNRGSQYLPDPNAAARTPTMPMDPVRGQGGGRMSQQQMDQWLSIPLATRLALGMGY